MRTAVMWVGYVLVAACVVGFASLFLRIWLAVPLGIAVTAGIFALPVTNPYGRN